MLPEIFFGYFACAILGLALLTVTRRNLVHSVLWMLLLFLHIACLYLFLNAEFLAVIQVIVYAGAILVLFLFLVMLLNLREEHEARRFVCAWQGRIATCLLLLMVVAVSLYKATVQPTGGYTIDFINRIGHTKVLGTVLFNQYILPFLMTALVLFVPMVAAIVLAMKEKKR
ncbi:MAG TPA: NADH-quinone oxidoreductase subunit J [Dissulfurispiraceae bacterium]|nr:NADH-quinone oxidoreductase subunit J [Dissulfurispiraceae bacterium]